MKNFEELSFEIVQREDCENGVLSGFKELTDEENLEIQGGIHPLIIVGAIIVVGLCIGLGIAYLSREEK
jgi:lactobin A/cerein 7B family class IIb bacteriocin